MVFLSVTSMLRQSNFELLRIFAMFLIVAHHYSVHGAWDYPPGFEVHKFYAQSLSIGGKLGVNLFVLISGYFLCKSSFKWHGFITVLTKTWFYSIFIVIIFYICDLAVISPRLFTKSLLPFGYWFVTTFLCMLALSPLINKAISKSSQKIHLRLILVFSVIAIIPILNKSVGNLSLFIYLYCIGAYLRIYYEKKLVPSKWLMAVISISLIAIIVSIAVLGFLSGINEAFAHHTLYFVGMKTPFILCLSVATFIYFKQLRIGYVKVINVISSTMFGVYLIHDNNLVRPFLWQEVFNNRSYLNSDLLYFHSLFSIVFVFIGCIAVDLLRSKIADTLRLGDLLKELSSRVKNVFIMLH